MPTKLLDPVWCFHRTSPYARCRSPSRPQSALIVIVAPPRSGDLLLCAKLLFIAAKRSSSQRSFTGHLDRGTDGVFEIVRVVGRGLISIAEVHAIVARAHLAQGEPEMSRDRFGFLERHGSEWC